MANQPNASKSPTAEPTSAKSAEAGRDGRPGERIADVAGDIVSGMADRARDVAGGLADRARDMASDVGDRLSNAAPTVGGSMKNLAGSIRERAPAGGMLGDASSAVAAGLESGGRYLEEEGFSGLGDELTSLVRRNPIPALLAGVAIGFLLARATSDRS
jgi:hypothetical protein